MTCPPSRRGIPGAWRANQFSNQTNPEAAKRAIRAGVNSIEHGTFLDDEALDMMKQHGTYLVPTLMAVQGLQEQLDKGIYIPPAISVKAQLAIANIRKTFQKALAKGVNVCHGKLVHPAVAAFIGEAPTPLERALTA